MCEDGSGVTSLQELDLKSAEQLAKFKQQIGEKFGDSEKLFQELDVHKIKKVRQQDFLERCPSSTQRCLLRPCLNGLKGCEGQMRPESRLHARRQAALPWFGLGAQEVRDGEGFELPGRLEVSKVWAL